LGGLIYLDSPVTVTLENIAVTGAVAKDRGGLVYVVGTTVPATLTIKNTRTTPSSNPILLNTLSA
jgi:hypothetical protein